MQGADAYIAGSAAGPSAVVRLPAGANWVDPAAWQHLPDLNGEQPEIAPGPLGPVALLEPPPFSKREELFTQRWTGLRWTAPGDVGGVSYDSSFALAGSGTRLTGIWAVDPPGFPYLLDMVTSTDGGTLWSSEATLAVSPTALYTLELATNPAGRGVAVNGGDTNARPIWVYVIDPRKANVARARFGDTTVQLRTDLGDCVSEQRVRLRVQAARGGDLVSPSGVLRSARVSVSRSRILHRSRWSTLVDLRRTRAKRTARVRLVPRHGRARTLRLDRPRLRTRSPSRRRGGVWSAHGRPMNARALGLVVAVMAVAGAATPADAATTISGSLGGGRLPAKGAGVASVRAVAVGHRGHRRRRAAALRALRPARALGGLRAAGRDHAVPWPRGGRSQGRGAHGRLRRRVAQAAPVAAPARGPRRAQAQGARRGGPELRVGDLPGGVGPALRRSPGRPRPRACARASPTCSSTMLVQPIKEKLRRRRRRARAPRPDHRGAEAVPQPLGRPRHADPARGG